MKKILITLLVLLLGIGVYYYPSFSNTLYVATGFSAKNICSGHFISGFEPKGIVEEALLPVSEDFGMVDFEVDDQKKVVTAHISGFYERKAVYREGLGCTLLAVDQQSIDTRVTPLITPQQSQDEAWPSGLAAVEDSHSFIDYSLLNQTIDAAFSEPDINGKRNVKAVVIVYKGKLIAEHYSEGVDVNTPLLSWSMAKSITGLQIGLLVKAGKLNISQPAAVDAWNNDDDPRSKITLDQLMRMSSGLEFNETYGINSDVSSMLSVEADAGGFAASKSLQYAPDTHWSYSSGTTNIISGIIKRAINGNFQDYYEYTQKQLFHPLGITTAIAETDASDTFIGSSYFYASARDYAKLGQFVLQNGLWNGEQLIPEDWIKYSTTPTKTWPLNSYGAQFWLNADPDSDGDKRKWPSVPSDAFYMSGFQGQVVVSIPSEDLVVVRLGFTKPGADKGIEQLISGTIQAISKSQPLLGE